MNVINKLIAVQQHSRLLFYSFLKATPFRKSEKLQSKTLGSIFLLLSAVLAIDEIAEC